MSVPSTGCWTVRQKVVKVMRTTPMYELWHLVQLEYRLQLGRNPLEVKKMTLVDDQDEH